MHCSGLHRKLIEFRNDERYCDINIQIQNTTMKCHRVVLASVSEFFDKMFYSTFRENNKEEIVLHEIDPLAFECILEFAYLGQEPNFCEITNNVYDVLKACDFLRVHDLVELCISHIMKHVSSIENVCEIYIFSCVSNYPILSDALSSHIAENFYRFSQNEEFLILSYEQLSTIMGKYQSFNSESVGPSLFKDANLLLDTIIRWISYAFQERKIYFLDLVSIVSFEKVSENYLKFLSNEYKVNVNGFIDLKSCLEAFFTSETTDALPIVVYKNPLKNSSLHVFVEYESLGYDTRRNVFSISKYQSKCQWSSIELEEGHIFDRGFENVSNVEMVALDEPYNYLYCLSLGSASFSSYSTVSFNEKKTLKVPHLKYSEFSTMSGFQSNSIYLYDHRASFKEEPVTRNIISVLNYKCEVDKWFTVPELKTSISYATLVSDHKLVYLIGGESPNEKTHLSGYVQAYDYRAPKWQELTKLSTSETFGPYRYQKLCCCCLNGKIYASDAKKIEVFDLVAGKWMILSHNNYTPNSKPIIYEMLPFEKNLWIFYAEAKSWCPWELIIFDPNAMIWLPYKSFLDSVQSMEENYEKMYLPDQFSEEGLQLQAHNMYGYEITFLNAVVFKPLDVNVLV